MMTIGETFMRRRTSVRLLRKCSAATLVELLFVVAIIAILASIAIPSFTSAIKKAQMSGTASTKRELVRTPHLDLSTNIPVVPAEEFSVNVYTDEGRPHRGERSKPVRVSGFQDAF